VTESHLNAQIGAAVRAARLARGVTQDDLASLLGVDRVTISRYEGGKRTLPSPALVRIATYLAISVSQLTPEATSSPDMARAPAALQPITLAHADAQQTAMQTVVRVLEQRPDLLPTVLDLLETLLDNDQGHAL
jgi:transcriptional regulator with XRE-family HTH domain